MVRAVRTECQTSDCDVKCRNTFLFQWKFQVHGPQLGWKTIPMILLKLCKIVGRVFIYLGFIFILYDNPSLDGALSTMGDSHQFLLDDYAVHPSFLYTPMCYR